MASVSVLRPFFTLDNTEETAHLNHDPQTALEIKSQKKKSKQKKRQLRRNSLKGINHADALNTDDFLGLIVNNVITI